jgi:hypothetical protein
MVYIFSSIQSNFGQFAFAMNASVPKDGCNLLIEENIRKRMVSMY